MQCILIVAIRGTCSILWTVSECNLLVLEQISLLNSGDNTSFLRRVQYLQVKVNSEKFAIALTCILLCYI